MTAHIPVRVADPFEDIEWAMDSFHEWQREGIRGLRESENNPREDADFDEWVALMSQPHMVDSERFARMADAELVAHSLDHRKFNRTQGRAS